MDENKSPAKKIQKAKAPNSAFGDKDKRNSSSKKWQKLQSSSNQEAQEVLLNLPAGFKYKMPGKNQRVLIGSIVVGLNVLLVISVVAYFYIPAFQDFIYNVGRG